MPKNRQSVPKDERQGELLAAATQLFLSQGYDGTKMADIGESAGVTRANLYWYFPSKDHVFAAVMDRVLQDELAKLTSEHSRATPAQRLVLGLEDMKWSRPLHVEMHGRLVHSPEIAAAHDRFIDWIRSLVYDIVDSSQRPDLDRELVADTAVMLFEGFNSGVPLPRRGHEMMRFFIEGCASDPR